MDPLETRLVDELTAALDTFIAAWESGTRPDLAAFVPATGDASLRHHALVELIKVDLEYGWTRGQGRLLEAYEGEFPELVSDGAPPAPLIHEEVLQRRQAGDAVSATEIARRYPTRAAELATLLDLGGDGDVARPEAAVGDTLDDFLLIEHLGEGAFATVFLARQVSMQRMVALKVSVDRGDEAQTLAQFDHPHIVRVFDQRRLPERDLRLLYMEYVPAGSLHAVIERVQDVAPSARNGRLLLDVVDTTLRARGEVPPSDSKHREALESATWPQTICLLGAQLADALDYAHTRGVQHRDVKPANVLLDRSGAAKLADFNVSRRDDAEFVEEIGGSLAYMAPEHLRASSPAHEGADLDAHADQFSLGVVLFELLTGSRPFADEGLDPTDAAKTFRLLVASHGAGLTPEARARMPADASPLLVSALARTLAPKAGDRFPRAADLARQLDLCRLPRAAALVTPSKGSGVWSVRRHPRWALLFAALFPNLILSALNTLYNLGVVVKDADNADFFRMVATVNIVAFSIGIYIVDRWIRRIAHQVRQRVSGGALDGPEIEHVRATLLRYPKRVMWVVFPLWVLGGIAFPVWLSARGRADPNAWLNFTGSTVLFGVLAATLCYFLTSRIVIRALYPMFVVPGGGTPADAAATHRVRETAARCLAVLTSVPFIALVALALIDVRERSPLLVLGVVGSASFAFAYGAMRKIREDMQSLHRALMLRSAQR